MSLADIFHAIQETPLGIAIRESALVYPIILSLHLSCIAIFGGMILITNLRILGVALASTPISKLYLALRPWKRVGFCIMVTCGILLGGSEADKYYPNPIFWTKLILIAMVLVHYLIFRGAVYSRPEVLDGGVSRMAKAAAVTSIIIWLGIMSAGRWIAYWEPPDMNKAQTTLPR